MLENTIATNTWFPNPPSATPTPDVKWANPSGAPYFFYPPSPYIHYPPVPLEYYAYVDPYQVKVLLDNMETNLIAAYQQNDIRMLKTLLQTTPPFFDLDYIHIKYENAVGEIKSDPLLLNACRQGKTEIMEVLIEAGADMDVQNFSSDSVLSLTYQNIAEESLLYQRMQSLLERGADPNVNVPKEQPLLTLAWLDNKRDIVELLLRYKANPDVYYELKGEGTLQPLLMAAYRAEDQDMVDLLLRYGADKDACEYDEYDDAGLSFNDLLAQNK